MILSQMMRLRTLEEHESKMIGLYFIVNINCVLNLSNLAMTGVIAKISTRNY